MDLMQWMKTSFRFFFVYFVNYALLPTTNSIFLDVPFYIQTNTLSFHKLYSTVSFFLDFKRILALLIYVECCERDLCTF